jgi:hypothetical protein
MALACLTASVAASGWLAVAGVGPAAAEQRQTVAALQTPPRPVPAVAPAAPRLRPAGEGWGALYVAGSHYGLAVNRPAHTEARGAAEALCARQSGGAACRLAAEFTGRCGAVAQEVDRAVLAALRPLGPAAIGATAAGAGATQEEAMRAAQEACARQSRGGGICIVTASACNGR